MYLVVVHMKLTLHVASRFGGNALSACVWWWGGAACDSSCTNLVSCRKCTHITVRMYLVVVDMKLTLYVASDTGGNYFICLLW